MKDINEEQLEQKLRTLAGEVKPSKDFEKALFNKVQGQFKAVHQTSFWSNFSKFKIQFAGILAILTLAITTNYAYRTNSVVPGEVLYPVKRGAEKIESIFVPEGLPKSDYYLDMAERRTEELKYIEEDAQFENTADETREFLNMAKEELEESSDTSSEDNSNSQTMMMEMDSANESEAMIMSDEEDEDASGVDTTDQENDEEVIEERIEEAEENLEEAEEERQEETTDSPASETLAPEAQ